MGMRAWGKGGQGLGGPAGHGKKFGFYWESRGRNQKI